MFGGITAAAINFYASVPAAAWSIGEFLERARQTGEGWAGLAMMLVGVIAIAFGGIQILIGLMRKNSGGQPVQWVPLILCIILGGAFLVGGWSFASSVAHTANQTIATLGTESGMGSNGQTYDFGKS